MNDDFYFIAEIGVNHEGDLTKALEMVEQVANAGAHAAKFQAYKANKLVVSSAKAYWDTSFETEVTQQALFAKYDKFDAEDYEIIHKKCRDCGIDFLATPFDLDAVDMLDELSSSFKIASADITNFPLLEKVAKREKHVFLSTGAASLKEVREAVDCLIEFGTPTLSLLHCVLNYPCSISNSFLSHISTLIEHFSSPKIKIGYSDHIPSNEVNNDQLVIAATLGCRVFERHFTHDTSLPGNDHYHSLDMVSLKNVIERIAAVLDGMRPSREAEILEAQSEAISQARRSVVIADDLIAGATIKESDLVCKRPGTGISPKYFKSLIGRKTLVDLRPDDILQWNDLESLNDD